MNEVSDIYDLYIEFFEESEYSHKRTENNDKIRIDIQDESDIVYITIYKNTLSQLIQGKPSTLLEKIKKFKENMIPAQSESKEKATFISYPVSDKKYRKEIENYIENFSADGIEKTKPLHSLYQITLEKNNHKLKITQYNRTLLIQGKYSSLFEEINRNIWKIIKDDVFLKSKNKYIRKPDKEINSFNDVRNELIRIVELDLLGPEEIYEKLLDLPALTYEIGKLYPRQIIQPYYNNDELGEDFNEYDYEDESSDDDLKSEKKLIDINSKKNMSMGMSMRPSNLELGLKLHFVLTFGLYRATNKIWQRIDHKIEKDLLLSDKTTKIDIYSQNYFDILEREKVAELIFNFRKNMLTVSLLNSKTVTIKLSYSKENDYIIFQPKIKLIFENQIQPISKHNIDMDIENSILYRNRKSYGLGHNCSVSWPYKEDEKYSIETSFIPKFSIPTITPKSVNKKSSRKIRNALNPTYLMDANEDDLIDSLHEIINEYGYWIDTQNEENNALDIEYLDIGRSNIDKCSIILDRMNSGLELLKTDALARKAFQLMNRSIHRVYKNKFSFEEKDNKFYWRYFQLGFILQSIESTILQDHEDRNVADLLWFPTGGGKTECYNGLTLIYLFYLRLTDPLADGVSVIMRYTLRLLTLQQFSRASEAILAAESVRREYLNGTTEFSIGLWVGGDLTPNLREIAKQMIDDQKNGILEKENLFVISQCPNCYSIIPKENYKYTPLRIDISCPNNTGLNCPFEKRLPIYLIDEDVYDNRPSLLLGTVDKFAQVVWQERTSSIFGLFPKSTPPGLIIQDELHLISGPLGSVVGIYEGMIEGLIELQTGFSPKIIASTATVRDADIQIKTLYDKDVSIFPPNALDVSDNFFSYENKNAPDRMYVGLPEGLRASLFLIIRSVAAIMQRADSLLSDHNVDHKLLDPYWSIVSYFNSLKELGVAVSASEEDIPNRLKHIINLSRLIKTNLPKLDPFRIMEGNEQLENKIFKRNFVIQKQLNSHCTSSDVKDRLDDMNVGLGEMLYEDKKPLDLLLSSNMLSVGIDVGRLGIMIMNGQPLTTSEYIQATSRVGRSSEGLIFTIYRMSYPRDRSHYEAFYQYHNALYSYVESSSSTPFALPVRQRALHAIIIGLMRHLHDKARPYDGAGNLSRSLLKSEAIYEFLARRINNSILLDEENKQSSIKHLDFLFDKINGLAGGTRKYRFDYLNSSTQYEENQNEDEISFATLNSMRTVDGSLKLNIFKKGGKRNAF